MNEDDIVREIMRVIRDFNDTDEFCKCSRLSPMRESRMEKYLHKEYALHPVYTGKGYLFLRENEDE